MNKDFRAFSVPASNKESLECFTKRVSNLVLQSDWFVLFLFARLKDRPVNLLRKYLINTFK